MQPFLNYFKKTTYCEMTVKLMIIYAIQSVCGGIAFYIALFLKNHTGLDELNIGILISATSIGNIIGSNIGGHISDKFNPYYALKIGLSIQGAALICLVFITNFYAILLIMTGLGAGSYLYITSSNYVLNSKFNSDQTNRTKIISNQNIISNIGMFVAAILMGYCAEGYYQPIFILTALIMISIAVTLKPFDKNFYHANVLDDQGSMPNKTNTTYYITGLIAIGVIGIIYSQHRIGYPVYLSSNFGNINTGYLMSLNPLIILLFQNFIIKQFVKVNEVAVLGLGLLLFGISFFVLNYSINIGMIFLACFIMTLGEILAITYAQSITFGYAPINLRGRILGIYKSIYSLTKIIGSYIAGLLINYTSYNTLWNFCGGIGVVAFISIIALFCTQSVYSKKLCLRSNPDTAPEKF